MLTLTLDDSGLQRAVGDLVARQMPYAEMMALNQTAVAVLDDVQRRMPQVFDRPTPWTRNAFMVTYATKATLQAEVGLKPDADRKQYLRIEEGGGYRPQTGLERLLSFKLPYEGYLRSVLPGDNAQLDAYGNWSAGQRNKVLSALQAQSDPFNNTPSAALRQKGRTRYFVPRRGLTPGIYARKSGARRDDIQVIAIFSERAPVYHPRLGFFTNAQKVFEAQLPDRLRTALAQALATAR